MGMCGSENDLIKLDACVLNAGPYFLRELWMDD
jgi:hypothetical protein